jgi:serine/threonine-protein phosphatase 5
MIPNEILFLHGGVSTKIRETNDLRFASKLIEEDVLWSDPSNGYGEYANMRGAGIEFGKDISEKVCNRLGVKRIIRSHQPQKAWKEPCIEHNGRVITVSSTKIYGGDAFILALPTTKLESVQILRNLTVYL